MRLGGRTTRLAALAVALVVSIALAGCGALRGGAGTCAADASLYDVILALPPLAGQPACSPPSQTLYGLFFAGDGFSLLSAVTDQSGCAAVTLANHDQRATTPVFWALARQAAS